MKIVDEKPEHRALFTLNPVTRQAKAIARQARRMATMSRYSMLSDGELLRLAHKELYGEIK